MIPNDQFNRPQERKVAYVQPQIQSSQHSKKPSAKQKKVDPIKALSSMASQPMISTTQSSSLSISHGRPSAPPLTVSIKIFIFYQKIVKFGRNLKNLHFLHKKKFEKSSNLAEFGRI